MNNKISILILSFFLIPGFCFGASHCLSNETVLLNAEIGKVDKKNELQKNGKNISLCVDKKKEPFTQITYRFGKIGNIELEEVFNEKKPINLEIQAEGYGGDKYSYTYIFSFYKGKIKYQISKGVGFMQLNNGNLVVSQNDKLLANFGFEIDEEDLLLIDTVKPKSKIFKR
jgi:hypothetical protein